MVHLSSLVYGQGAFGIPTLDLEGCGLPCLALGGSGLVSVFGQGPPLYAVLSFQFKLPALGEDRVLQNLVRSFAIERPRRPQAPPSWDLNAVLRHLMSSAFEPLESVSLRALTKKTWVLVSCDS